MQLAFFDADVQWSGEWQSELEVLSQQLSAAGVPLGVIYNGDPTDTTGVSWVATAIQRFSEIESDPNISVAQAIFQSWNAEPAAVVSEDTLGSMTNLALTYLEGAPLLREGNGSPVSGTLLPLSLPNELLIAAGTQPTMADLGLGLTAAGSPAAQYVIVLTAGSAQLSSSPNGQGTVSGNNTTSLMLTGDLTDIGIELASTVISETASQDQLQVSAFNSNGQICSSLLSIKEQSITTIQASPQNLAFENQVGGVYEQVLGRDPSSTELSAGIAAMSSGTTLAALRSSIAFSLGSTQIVSGYYEGEYNRAPTGQEVQTWENELASGMGLNVLQSPFVQYAENEVTQLYLEVEGRPVDQGGLQGFTAAVLNGLSYSGVRSDLAYSTEFS